MKKIIIPVLTIIVAVGAWWWYNRLGNDGTASPYRVVAVERGDLESTVAATGALSAVKTVQVGTQVSGQIQEIFADFNDRVRKGQLIAQIDPTPLRQSVEEADARLERSRAEVDQRQSELDRARKLFDSEAITESELSTFQYNLAVAEADQKSTQVAVERARQNLTYTNIHSPIDGVVVERNVDVGQTVAASLSAPQLFLIAEDLSRMEILASVDESDIGRIAEGQQARFTVQAYPDDTFHGAVRQVRLQSTMEENVVNYTVVIDVRNTDGRLLPGMTATVDFLVDAASDVLKVSNAALRFRPTEAMVAALRTQRDGQMAALPDSVRERSASRRAAAGSNGNDQGEPSRSGETGPASLSESSTAAGGRNGVGGRDRFDGTGGFGRSRNTGMLWLLDENGSAATARVRLGITDGRMTEIEGRGIEEGMQVISGVTVTGESGSPNPFQSGGEQPRRPGGF